MLKVSIYSKYIGAKLYIPSAIKTQMHLVLLLCLGRLGKKTINFGLRVYFWDEYLGYLNIYNQL